VAAKEDVHAGALLFVSETVGSALTGQLGQHLQPQDLQAAWTSGSKQLTAADRYKLSLLHRPGSQGPPVSVTFKDFSDDKASTKAKKASSKGFGAAATAKQASTAAAAAAAAAADLSAEQLGAVLACNAYGDDHLDGGLTACRKEQQASIIGAYDTCPALPHTRALPSDALWAVVDCLLLLACADKAAELLAQLWQCCSCGPRCSPDLLTLLHMLLPPSLHQPATGVWPEFALLNHSCAPNTVPPVLLQDRLLLRSALPVPAGEEFTTSYLGLAGGMPLQQRRQLLQQHYGFACGCHRCKVGGLAGSLGCACLCVLVKVLPGRAVQEIQTRLRYLVQQ
jgi:hypothetical protein